MKVLNKKTQYGAISKAVSMLIPKQSKNRSSVYYICSTPFNNSIFYNNKLENKHHDIHASRSTQFFFLTMCHTLQS